MIKYILGLILLLLPILGQAQHERIINYHTDLSLDEDRTVILTETIEIYVLGNRIKRGITRNFPASRKLKDRSIRMKYDILEISKNGKTEPYHTERNNGDVIFYIGSRDVYLTPGTYTYVIKYQVPNQIAFFEDFDEIYWNVIGHDVTFEVENASCTVHLPKKALMTQEESYVGEYGSQSKEFTMEQSGNQLHYVINKKLKPQEGFTIAIGFQKGFFEPPSFLHRYGTLLLILLTLVLLLPYYFITWFRYGRDPASPPAYPIWDAPDELSPASLNYLRKGKAQNSGLTASIIHLAIQGYLKIEERVEKGFIFSSKKYSLIKVKSGDSQLSPEAQVLMSTLFNNSTVVNLDGKYDDKVDRAVTSHRSSLGAQHDSFIREGNNVKLVFLPLILTVVVGILATVLLFNSPYAEWINIKALLIFAPVAILGLFLYGYLIAKPTIKKLDLLSRIEGFKMYLKMAEADRLQLLNPPELTPEHFEAALPYAFALGVQHEWSDRFKDILAAMQYRPDWNNGADIIYFSNNFGGDFSKSMSTASTKPSSSGSGSGGGGFSGGGGGGGGVGGW